MTEIKQTMAEVQAEARRCLYCVDAPASRAAPPGWTWRSLSAICAMPM